MTVRVTSGVWDWEVEWLLKVLSWLLGVVCVMCVLEVEWLLCVLSWFSVV